MKVINTLSDVGYPTSGKKLIVESDDSLVNNNSVKLTIGDTSIAVRSYDLLKSVKNAMNA